ncbi:hypothetical protein SAMN05216355_101171 [Actinomyces ruminicola]|uniref:Uncharacterized protein n=1 Tax=Actinomyces ruminicola TaxID=332524 RepID=A0A1G9ZF81_9ACTO|nr:hypothetical protein [Actinomyces ruminicola]SDN19845.1 hypothetical protein SAMN05216355_101171 [Actinomyces ruminicola]
MTEPRSNSFDVTASIPAPDASTRHPTSGTGTDAGSTDAVAPARTKRQRPWYRRTWVAGVAGVAVIAAAFGAGWGANELLSPEQTPAGIERGDFDPRQGGPGGGQMPGNGQMPGGQMPDGETGQGGAGRTTPNDDATGGSGDGGTSEGGDSAGVLQNEDTSA